MNTDSAWPAPTASGPIRTQLSVPGSKSLTNRELILAAIAETPGTLHSPLYSDDSARMLDALRALGIQVETVPGTGKFGDDLRITPNDKLEGNMVIDCGQAGTVMRFVAAIAGLVDGDVTLTAHESALHRPMGAMIKALRNIGVDIDDGGTWSLPFTVHGHGHIRGGQVVIDASASSQFVSALLMAAPRFDVGLHLIHSGDRLPSMPHIDMTIHSLARRGVAVEQVGVGEWIVPPGNIRGKNIAIEPDLSNASPFLAAALLCGGAIGVSGWPAHSTQPGALLQDLLPAFGGRAARRAGIFTARGTGAIKAVNLDLRAAGELAPTLFALAAFADGPSTLTGIGHIRGHETNRIAALVDNLRALGGRAEELEDGIRIFPTELHGGVWKAYHDHRIATAGALIGLRVPGVEIDDIGTTAKTMPEFPQLWHELLSDEGSSA